MAEEKNNQIVFTTADDAAPNDDPLMTAPRNYELYVSHMDEGNALVQVDVSLNRLAPVPAYHWLLGIQVEMQNPDMDGFYTEEEAPRLLAIQERVVELLETDGQARYVGTVTYAGTRMLYFYGKDESYLAPLVGNIAAEFSDYDFNFMSENDGPWRFFFSALYPSDLDMMLIRNRHLLENLAEAGLDLRATYPISYYFYFQDGASRAQAAARFAILGYEIIDDHMLVEALEPMSLGLKILARHDLNYETVTEKNYECFEVMEDYIGIFDGWELAPAEDIKGWI